MKNIPLLVLLSFPAWAQPGSDTAAKAAPYTLAQAVRVAIENNHELAAARLEVDRADAQVSEAWGTALPRIDFKARYTNALLKPVFFLPDFANPGSGKVTPIEVGSNHALDMTFSAEQVLFNYAVFTGVGAAKIYASGARALYRAQEVAAVTRVRKAYYAVLLAREGLALARETMKFAEENHANIKLLASQGLVSEYDLLRSDVTVENIRPEVIKSENNYRLALNGLKVAMGIPYSQHIEVTDTMVYTPMEEELLTSATTRTLSENPGLQAARYQSEVSDAFLAVQRSDFLPTLSAFGSYQFVNQKNQLGEIGEDLIEVAQVGLSLSFNLFNGFQTTARVEQAHLDVLKSQEQVAGLELGLQTNAESSVLNLREAQQRIEAQGRTVQQAERGYRIAQTRYQSGAGTLLELNDGLLALSRAKLNRLQALYDYLVASADVDQTIGRIPEQLRIAEHND